MGNVQVSHVIGKKKKLSRMITLRLVTVSVPILKMHYFEDENKWETL